MFISDTHGFHREPNLVIPDGDVLIHCGDLTMQGERDVLQDLNDWFGELEHNYKVVIGGNHDTTLGGADMFGFKIFTNAIYLEDSSVEIEGFKIWGSPYTGWSLPRIADMFAFADTRNNLQWRGMPRDVDILVTHSPPHGILDKVTDSGFNPGEHVGDKKLLEKIQEYRPKVNSFGHIHEGYGIIEEKDTTFINCSVVNERYDLVNSPIELHL